MAEKIVAVFPDNIHKMPAFRFGVELNWKVVHPPRLPRVNGVGFSLQFNTAGYFFGRGQNVEFRFAPGGPCV